MTDKQEPDIRKAVDAIRHGRADELRTLLCAELLTARGVSLLRFACRMGSEGCMRILLSATVPVTSGGNRLYRALVAVRRARYFAPVMALCGAEFSTAADKPLIHQFAWRGETAAVEKLVRLGCNIETRERECMTPLMSAVYSRSVDCARRLVQLGANVNAQDRYGNTPLMAAVSANCPALVHFLLDHGANADMKDRGGRTAMDDAARAFRPLCRAILAQHQTRPAE